MLLVGQYLTHGNYADGLMMRTLLIMQSEICLSVQGAYASPVPHVEG